MASRKLLPDDATLARWSTLREAREWATLEDAAWHSIAVALGDKELDSPALLAAMAPDLMRQAIAQARGTQRSPQCFGACKGVIAMVFNAVRAKFDLELADVSIDLPTDATPLAHKRSASEGEPKHKAKRQSMAQAVTWHVDAMSGRRCTVLLPPNASVADLKTLACAQLGLLPATVRLMSDERILPDTSKLCKAGVESNSAITAVAAQLFVKRHVYDDQGRNPYLIATDEISLDPSEPLASQKDTIIPPEGHSRNAQNFPGASARVATMARTASGRAPGKWTGAFRELDLNPSSAELDLHPSAAEVLGEGTLELVVFIATPRAAVAD